MKNASSRKNFDLEALEPRLMLNASGVSPAPQVGNEQTGLSQIQIEEAITPPDSELFGYDPAAQMNEIFGEPSSEGATAATLAGNQSAAGTAAGSISINGVPTWTS